jgi:hypothetical protein
MVTFIVRLVGYGLLLGVASRVFQTQWSRYGLDDVARLHHFHDVGVMALLVAPAVLALFGVGLLRQVTVFVAFYLVGAALTAPLVCARIAGL